MKKFISILLTLTLILSSGVFALAAKGDEIEFLKNGDFESNATANKVWTQVYFPGPTEHHKSGVMSLRQLVEGDTKLRLSNQDVEGVKAGAEYKFTGFIYPIDYDASAGPCVQISFFDDEGNKTDNVLTQSFNGVPKGKWTEVSFNFIAPAKTTKIGVGLRLNGHGEVYWDDVSLIGEYDEERIAAQEAYKKRLEDVYEWALAKKTEDAAEVEYINPDENILKNPGFEEADATGMGAALWNKQGDWGQYISINSDPANVYEGNYSMQIKNDNFQINPWFGVTLTDADVTPGKTYILSAMVKLVTHEQAKGAIFKVEASRINADGLKEGTGGGHSDPYIFDDSEWHEVRHVFTVPELTQTLPIYFRLQGSGEIYYDNVRLAQSTGGTAWTVKTKDTFSYTENKTNEVYAEFNNRVEPIEIGSYVNFKLKDGDRVLDEKNIPAERLTTYTYDVSLLSEEWKQYKVEVTYMSKDGTPLRKTKTEDVYRCDRPKAIGDDGLIYDREGRVITPFEAYQPFEGAIDKTKSGMSVFAEGGVTVTRSWKNFVLMKDEEIKAYLDSLYENNIYLLGQLYSTVPAGHPDIVDKQVEFVKKWKDHPAIYAWKILDEPSTHYGETKQIRLRDEMMYWLRESYIAIRQVDDFHPISCLDNNEGDYEFTARFCDILETDPYPRGNDRLAWVIPNSMETAQEAVHGEKPIVPVVQAFLYGGTNDDYMPTADGIRIEVYQTMMGGAYGFGYFGFATPDGKWYLHETDRWPGLKAFKQTGEMDEMFDYFVKEKYPTFGKYVDMDTMYESWVHENGDIYLVVLNRQPKANTIKIDLSSVNDRIKIGGYTATLINGNTPKTITGNGTFEVYMKEQLVSMYKLVPDEKIDVSALDLPKYDDLAGFDWAEDAIMTTFSEGISNDITEHTFEPGTNITRGDFAMFLIRTLGLTEGADTPNFADVDPNAHYAKEIAIGRAAGILNGVGDNKYNPEEHISRQDLMTICARGLAVKGIIDSTDRTVELEQFTDAGLTADYAAAHIAAMVRESIVKGNPDGTVNPLGNTTRAEAAVIMSRILPRT